MANLLGKRKLEDGLQTELILKRHRDLSGEKETTKGFADDLRMVELLETTSDETTLVSVKDTMEGIVEEAAETVNETPPHFSEMGRVANIIQEHPRLKKTIFVSHLPPETTISDIIDFFKDVGRVVCVGRQISHEEDQPIAPHFVEFASVNEAKMALEKKKGEYFHNQEIKLAVPHHKCFPPKFCIDHKVWNKEDETPPEFAKKAAMKTKTLFVANLSPQTTKILQILHFFGGVAEVVSVRLIVNHEGKHVGYGFVEFDSPSKAEKALESKNGRYLHDHKILLKELDETPSFAEAVATVRNKTLFIARLARQTKISDIINFFKDVGEVVHVRLILDHKTRHVTFGFVEFASANEAEKALEKKNRENLHNQEIFLDIVKPAIYPLRSKYCIDHKVWYPQRESLVVKEDEGLDETLDFVEEVASREKTVFVARDTPFYASKIINFFKDVGKVVGVRLTVDDLGEPVGCGFVEFVSANEAKKAVQKRNDLATYVTLPELAPYPFQPKYNLADLAEKLWYEDNLQREGFGLPLFKPKLKKQLPRFRRKKKKAVFCGTRITFSDSD